MRSPKIILSCALLLNTVLIFYLLILKKTTYSRVTEKTEFLLGRGEFLVQVESLNISITNNGDEIGFLIRDDRENDFGFDFDGGFKMISLITKSENHTRVILDSDGDGFPDVKAVIGDDGEVVSERRFSKEDFDTNNLQEDGR